MNPVLASLLTPLAVMPPSPTEWDDPAEHLPFILAMTELLQPAIALELGRPRLARWLAASPLPTRVVPLDAADAARPASLVVVHGEETERWREALAAPLAEASVVIVHGLRADPGLPSFRFDHGAGLVAFCPGAIPPPLHPLFEAGPAEVREVRAVFSALGARCVSAARAEAEGGRLEKSLEEQRSRTAELQARLAAIEATWAWKVGRRYQVARDRLLAPGTRRRAWLDAVTRGAKVSLSAATRRVRASRGTRGRYDRWITANTPSRRELSALRGRASELPTRPLVSILTPVHDVSERRLRRCVESVRAQVYPEWELCLADATQDRPHVWQLLQEYAARDPRIRVERSDPSRGIASAAAHCLALARGEFVALLEQGDELAPEALFEIARRLGEDPHADVLYSDEDELDSRGRRDNPFFKPEWSPDLLLSFNYAGHVAVLRRSLAVEVGGFRPGFEGSDDHDLLLRATERARSVVHLPKVIYHRVAVPDAGAAPRATPTAFEASRRAVEDALARRGIPGTATMPRPGIVRVRRHVAQPPLVSIVVPTRDRADLMRALVGSLEARTSYPRWELVVVDNGTSEADAVEYLASVAKRHHVVRDDSTFNWSALNNRGVRSAAAGPLLLFLNNDIEVVEHEWLDALVEHAVRPEVGAVGAKLLYPSGTIQHAGVVLGIGGVANHAFKHFPGDSAGYFGLAAAIRPVSAVTGACLMARRDAFEEVGGFDERLRVAFNDIDFCLKLRARGYQNIYTPYATLVHHESATREALHPPADEALMYDRWREILRQDPYYSPHLTRERENYGIGG